MAGGVPHISIDPNGPGIDEPLAQEDGASALSFFQADGLGSVVKTTSPAGAVTASKRYDAFGNLELGAANGYAFTGRESGYETGLAYYRARYYDPKVGRFISEDPIGFAGGINLYNYVGGAAPNATDPFGLVKMTTNQNANVVPDPRTAQPPCDSDYGCAHISPQLDPVCDDCGVMRITITLTATIVVRSGMYIPFPPGRPRPKDSSVINEGSATAHEERHITDIRRHLRRFLNTYEKQYSSKEECEAAKQGLRDVFPLIFKMFARQSQRSRG